MTGPALLDVAQDYALQYLHQHAVFDPGVVLKGGTSLRKFRAGNAGRFSTDLDFAAPDVDTGEFVLDTVNGATIEGVSFAVTNRGVDDGKSAISTTCTGSVKAHSTKCSCAGSSFSRFGTTSSTTDSAEHHSSRS